ncbi:hypothetical protein [Dyadobacter pollutisoli]|uniref:Addiction module component n=1 Tax=Dyadobacter pollutisoli TaxID=2910158 RepID=A0A9E8SJY1_9BACT|nr:hypothetical protein [Dyadobacter pollutisoli]WAC10201.1 hypothetical protein ON006_20865 [Dyadobacter pollutisoli]
MQHQSGTNMALTYHIRIKKDYAASLIEDLQKMDAIELVKELDDENVPAWQKEEVNQRIKKYKDQPDLLIDEDPVFKMLDAE